MYHIVRWVQIYLFFRWLKPAVSKKPETSCFLISILCENKEKAESVFVLQETINDCKGQSVNAILAQIQVSLYFFKILST